MRVSNSGRGYQGDEYHETVAVLATDALGVNSLLNCDEVALRAANAIDGLVAQTRSSQLATLSSQSQAEPPSDPLMLYTVSRYFGDSIYLFADPTASLETQVRRLAAVACSILYVGFISTLKDWLLPYMPRIGIGQGNLRIRPHDEETPSYEVRIGDSMALAHKIEKAQDWIGGALPSELSHENDLSSEYEIPLHKEYDGPPLRALNWLQFAIANPGHYPLNDLVKDMVKYSIGLQDEKARTKWENSCSFAAAMLERSST